MGVLCFKRLFGPSFNEELNCGVWRWAGGSAPVAALIPCPTAGRPDKEPALSKSSTFQLPQALTGPWDSSVDMSFSLP